MIPSRLIRHAVTTGWDKNFLPRFWDIRKHHFTGIGRNPGGYLQWEDAHLGRNITKGIMAEVIGKCCTKNFSGAFLTFITSMIPPGGKKLGCSDSIKQRFFNSWLGKAWKTTLQSRARSYRLRNWHFSSYFGYHCVRYIFGQVILSCFKPFEIEGRRFIPFQAKKECEEPSVALFFWDKERWVYHLAAGNFLARKAF